MREHLIVLRVMDEGEPRPWWEAVGLSAPERWNREPGVYIDLVSVREIEREHGPGVGNLLDLSGVAAFIGTTRKAAEGRYSRGTLPTPLAILSGRPIWAESQLLHLRRA